MASASGRRPNLRIPAASNMNNFRCDDETGEMIAYRINDETGEPSMENLLRSTNLSVKAKHVNATMKFPYGNVSKSRKFQALIASIKSGSNTTSYRLLLLIPTLMIFPRLICVILFILEIYLHVRCHKNNKKLSDPNLYYRSPFHIVTSIFCGVCRESDMASKVGQLQDKRRDHYDYIRRIAI